MLKNMKIGHRLVSAFVIISILASLSGIVTIVMIKNVNTGYSMALQYYGFAQGDVGKAMLALTRCQTAVSNIVSFTIEEDINQQKAELETNWNNYREIYSPAVQASLTTDEGRAIFENIAQAGNRWLEIRDEIIKIGDVSDVTQTKRAQEMLVNELNPAFEGLYKSYADLMNLKVQQGDALSSQLTNQSNLSIFVAIGIIAGAMAISCGLGIFISRSISVPIGQCAKRLDKLSMGDLHSPVPDINTKDETGVLANSTEKIVTTINGIIGDMSYNLDQIGNGNFTADSQVEDLYVGDFQPLEHSMQKIIYNLSSALSQINQSSDQVSSGSDQVASGAQALSQGATEQASSIEELSATIMEISQQIKHNAANAANAKQEAETAGREILESNRRMQNMIAAMNDISGKSNEIGKIIKTIDDIAFQTNILALNAAVEAARAGAAGKGFAVVADEVRNLAGKSAEAAKNTAGLIEETIQAVENGALMADDTAKAILAVVDGARAVTAMVEEIAIASNEQANAVGQVTQGIEQISAVVQTNSATAEESAAASEELSGQAQMLKNLVGRFKLCDEDEYQVKQELLQSAQ